MATGVKKISKGKFQINFFLGGQRFWKTIEAGNAKEAEDSRAEWRTEIREKLKAKSDPSILPNSDFAKVWEELAKDIASKDSRGLNHEKKKHKRYLNYRRVFNRMFYEFREKEFPQVTTPGELDRGLGLRYFRCYQSYFCVTLNRAKGWRSEWIFVRSIINKMRILGYLSESLIEEIRKDIDKGDVNKKEYPDIAKDLMKKLLNRIEKEKPFMYGVIYFMSRTGRRIEESLLISLSDVVWEKLAIVKLDIRAETTKGNKRAPLIAFDSSLQKHLDKYYRGAKGLKSEYLFCDDRGRKLTQRRVCDYLKKVSKEVCGVAITPHYFRHRFFTECDKKNVSRVDVMAISGLRSAEILDKYYSHSTTDGLAGVFAKTRI
jgi:integrase